MRLSSAGLRKEVVRALKLKKNWLSEDGPAVTSEITIPVTSSGINLIRGIPEAELVFVLRRTGILECWCLKERGRVWSFSLEPILKCAMDPTSFSAFDYEIADENSTVMIAMCVESEES